MDSSKFGLRSLLGIAAPGAILAITLAYGLFNLILFHAPYPACLELLRNAQWLLVTALLLLSYLFGSLLRVHPADSVDAISGRVLELKHLAEGGYRAKDLPLFRECRERVLAGSCENAPEGFDEWLLSTEAFPYPASKLRLFALSHPPEVMEYFQGALALPRQGFFEYCKMVVASREAHGGGAMLSGVQAAEARTRFFAGTYFALRYSAALMTAFLLWLVASSSLQRGRTAAAAGLCGLVIVAGLVYRYMPIANVFRRAAEPESESGEVTRARYFCMWLLLWWLYAVGGAMTLVSGTGSAHLTASFVIAFTAIMGAQLTCGLIQENFRRLRMKEVDTVLQAFYLGSR